MSTTYGSICERLSGIPAKTCTRGALDEDRGQAPLHRLRGAALRLFAGISGALAWAPWYFGIRHHQDDTDGGKIRRVAPERRQEAWILTGAHVARLRPRFLQSGIDFPDGYLNIGAAINPTTGLEIGIWKPLNRH